MPTTSIIITAIICVTLIVLCTIPLRRGKSKEPEYEYRIVHVNVPRGEIAALEKGIRTGLTVFPGEVVAVAPDPFYPDMDVPTYSIIIKTPFNKNTLNHLPARGTADDE